MSIRTDRLADTVGFEILGEALGKDVEISLRTALSAGAVFSVESDPLLVFRESLAESIRTIETDERSILFQRFLKDGPYEDSGEIPSEMVSKRLSDDETAAAIRFIYYRVINHFQGSLGELLAVAPCVQLIKELQHDGRFPLDAQIYVGDAVAAGVFGRPGFSKGADMHILVIERSKAKIASVTVAGVVEVKSYPASQRKVLKQSRKHLRRVGLGMHVGDAVCAPEQVRIGCDGKREPVRVAVVPASWTLPRTFRFEGPSLIVDSGVPLNKEAHVVSRGNNEWRITLRWSHEALAQAAYEMTFWYMGKIGEIIYGGNVPKEWSEMTPVEAGRNAIKMMLYYAIMRCRTKWEHQRAVALYNTYSFGYALGMNFRNVSGSREMLWPEDLHEIAKCATTKHGCIITK
jgi:hypothetical protein